VAVKLLLALSTRLRKLMASKQEILDQIAALQAEADDMGEEDEFEVEIWNEKGEGARLPHGQTTRWLKSKFPDLFDPEPDPDADNSGEADKGKGTTGGPRRRSGAGSTTATAGTRNGTASKYFGKRPAGK
jgi:hypothetical protein